MTDEQLPDVAGTSAHDVDVYVPDPEHAALWARARSIGEMGELMARWLTGEISYQPGYAGPGPDSETRELVPVLAEVNRAGLVTDFSQPGVELDEHGNGQRAAVAGLCTQATAAWLRAAVRRTAVPPRSWRVLMPRLG